ncbi:hypothetical protein BT63DRAFT_426171 [Microthyrium microscopicum]|uniref:Uncharacterized protein n=1 Tax=Microthyrium microscopicum TaxID=703497 RepID=A0A6A6U555_9PEZI|nr:hypothetical protein BT63DRAFT_426171 [Microthyrium microscopicum]
MWNAKLLQSISLASTIQSALAAGVSTLAYTPAVLDLDYAHAANTSSPNEHFELLKRDGNCPSGYSSCAYIGAPAFCCKGNANCAIDSVGHAACCPAGAVCTGTINGNGFVTAGSATTSTTTTTAGGGVVVAGTTASPATLATGSASVVPNAYYPYKIIPTTYTNAGACSAAWSGCQTDLARCTAYLQGSGVATVAATIGGVTGNAGVTISAPNIGGGSTLPSPTITLPAAQASSVCSSLSIQACSNLNATACVVFGTSTAGNGAGHACGMAYTAVVGGAVGIAGGLLL